LSPLGNRTPKSDGDVPLRFRRRLPQPSLCREDDVPDSAAAENGVGRALGVTARDEHRNVRLEAPARSPLVGKGEIGQVNLVDDLRVLLRALHLFHGPDEMTVGILVPVSDVQLPFPGGQISTLLDVACNCNVAFASLIPGTRDGANHGRR